MRSSTRRRFSAFAVQRILDGHCVLALLILAGPIAPVRGDTGVTGGNTPVENRQPTLVMRYIIALNGIFPDDAQSTPTQSSPPDRTTPFLGEIKVVPFNFAPGGWTFCEGQALAINQNIALYQLIGTTYGGNGTTTFNLPDLRGRLPMGAGQGTGLPNYQLGSVVGNASPVLSVDNLPAHAHALSGGTTATTGGGAAFDNRQSSLALHFLIAANGEIMIVSWTRQPTGWAQCDGRLLSSATHGYLFGNIGTTYGGNSTNFAIPDLRGRVVVGDDYGTTWPRGLNYGSNNVVLTVSDIPSHTHTISGGSTGATGGAGNIANNYQPSLVMRWLISLFGSYPSSGGGGTNFPIIGELRLIAGAAADGLSSQAWKPLDGALYSIGNNDALFSLIGTTYGGDGQSTFAVPDLRSFTSTTAVGSLSIGSIVGTQTLNISISQMAAHSHSFPQVQISAIQHFASGNVQLTLTGTPGNTCQVDKSDDLMTWSNLGGVTFSSATGTIGDPNPTHVPKRFYKAYFPNSFSAPVPGPLHRAYFDLFRPF